jgi:FixJ family two-component response regulator
MIRKKLQRFVAVVEDDESVRLAIEDLLQSQGLATRCFTSAEEFLRSRQHARIGCLILDIRLPGMSGVELYQQLRARGVSIPVIYASAEGDANGKLHRELLQAGAVAVLAKPFNPERLMELVRTTLKAGQRR